MQRLFVRVYEHHKKIWYERLILEKLVVYVLVIAFEAR